MVGYNTGLENFLWNFDQFISLSEPAQCNVFQLYFGALLAVRVSLRVIGANEVNAYVIVHTFLVNVTTQLI